MKQIYEEDINCKINSLEQSLLKPEIRKSRDILNKLLSDDFLEFGSSGVVYNKHDMLELLPLEPLREMKIEDFQIQNLAKDIVLATYKTIENKLITLRTSIWKKEGDDWRLFFHQGTKRAA